MEKGIYNIETWEDFKREIKRQFYPEDVAYLTRKNVRRLKHTGSIHDYVKEFSSLMLEIPNMTEEDFLFNFMDNLGDSSKVESLEDSHATGGGDVVSRDHNAPRMGSGKTPNAREGRLLGALQVNPKPSTPKTSLLSGAQVKEAKREQAEGLHPSKASQENEVKSILAERVTRRQGVPPMVEYLVRWKGLPKRQRQRRGRPWHWWGECHKMLQMTLPMAYIGGGKFLETLGAIYTKSLVGRVWKVLEMPKDVHTSLHYGGKHERSPRLFREF
ncbi:hypothetical protein CK203_037592 [Vitis vinifera]|uniref:Retrotransposon gag domain-containing protein n=1 Tax=Vitis vinifera TaxID=29760 RepID=A0A438HKL7_VITVI|nr:hypothetical protein CK203_037592 [Vitis vinifera]